jgi:hypothetical protein
MLYGIFDQQADRFGAAGPLGVALSPTVEQL